MCGTKVCETLTCLQEAEEDHGLVEHGLDLRVGEALDALLQLVVDEEREVLGRTLVQVEEELKVAGDGLLEEAVVVEGGAQEAVVLVLQVQQVLHVRDGVGRGRSPAAACTGPGGAILLLKMKMPN